MLLVQKLIRFQNTELLEQLVQEFLVQPALFFLPDSVGLTKLCTSGGDVKIQEGSKHDWHTFNVGV